MKCICGHSFSWHAFLGKRLRPCRSKRCECRTFVDRKTFVSGFESQALGEAVELVHEIDEISRSLSSVKL